MRVFHLFLCVRGAPTWLVSSGKSLKLVTPDHWKLSYQTPNYMKKIRSAWEGFAGKHY